MKKTLFIIPLIIFSGCLSVATEDQCKKACFNQVAIQEGLRHKTDWSGQIESLKAAEAKELETLEKDRKKSVRQLEEAAQAVSIAKKKTAIDKKVIEKLHKKYTELKKSVHKKYSEQINKLREEKLKAEIKTQKRVKAAIRACVKRCRKQKWTEKLATCISGAKTPAEIKKCF